MTDSNAGNGGQKYDMVLTDELCDLLFPAAFHISFRLVRLYHIFLSLISIFSILYFTICVRSYLKFHFNIKILFYFQLMSCFLHAVVFGIFQTHHLITALTVYKRCDVVLSPMFYGIFHIPFSFSIFCISISHIFIVFERTIASCFFSCYEKSTKAIGIVLTVFTILLPIILCTFIYYGVSFTYPVMSVLATPPMAMLKINLIFVTLVVSYTLISFHSIVLYKYNQKKNGIARSLANLALSSKYQISENALSSQIMWQSTFLQLSTYLIYGIAMFSIRVCFPNPRSAFWIVVTELCYTPSVYCALMPLLCIFAIQRSNVERTTRISSLVGMRSTGSEGWLNYQKMLQNQWA